MSRPKVLQDPTPEPWLRLGEQFHQDWWTINAPDGDLGKGLSRMAQEWTPAERQELTALIDDLFAFAEAPGDFAHAARKLRSDMLFKKAKSFFEGLREALRRTPATPSQGD
ncbi:MAG: hypothetical protein AAF668_11480 [Pseudomonadota bacterium]